MVQQHRAHSDGHDLSGKTQFIHQISPTSPVTLYSCFEKRCNEHCSDSVSVERLKEQAADYSLPQGTVRGEGLSSQNQKLL